MKPEMKTGIGVLLPLAGMGAAVATKVAGDQTFTYPDGAALVAVASALGGYMLGGRRKGTIGRGLLYTAGAMGFYTAYLYYQQKKV